MFWIKIKSINGIEYEGAWNGKYYDSKVPIGKHDYNTYRIYINNKELIIDSKSKIMLEIETDNLLRQEKKENQKIKHLIKSINDFNTMILNLEINEIEEYINNCINLYNKKFNNNENNLILKYNSRFEALEL